MATLLAGGGVLTSAPLDRQGTRGEPCRDPSWGSRRGAPSPRSTRDAARPHSTQGNSRLWPSARWNVVKGRCPLGLSTDRAAPSKQPLHQTADANGFAWNREPMAASNSRNGRLPGYEPLRAASSAGAERAPRPIVEDAWAGFPDHSGVRANHVLPGRSHIPRRRFCIAAIPMVLAGLTCFRSNYGHRTPSLRLASVRARARANAVGSKARAGLGPRPAGAFPASVRSAMADTTGNPPAWHEARDQDRSCPPGGNGTTAPG
jgi:hypothetical protein